MNETPISPALDDKLQMTGTASGIRYRAAAIDNFIAIFCFMVIGPWVNDYLPARRTVAWDVLLFAGAVVVYSSYYFVFEALCSSSPGKMLTGLTVRHTNGQRCNVRGAFLRSITRFIEVNPILGALPAVLMIHVSERRQRLGDMLAKTVVIPVSQAPPLG